MWAYTRGKYLGNRVFKDYDELFAVARDAWTKLDEPRLKSICRTAWTERDLSGKRLTGWLSLDLRGRTLTIKPEAACPIQHPPAP